MVLGIDEGWSARAQATLGRPLRIDPGTYRLTVSITEPYRTAFGIAAEDAEVSVPVIATESHTEPRTTGGRLADDSGNTLEAQTQRTSAPIGTPPDSTLPDLEALPAYGIFVDNKRKSGRVLHVHSERRRGTPDLAPWSSRAFATRRVDHGRIPVLLRGRRPVNKLPAGQLAYDNRDGHDHWHFKDFAAYSLLTPT